MLLEALYWVSSLGWMLRAITQDEAMMAVFEHGICPEAVCAAAADDCSEFALPRHTRKGLVFNLTLLYGFGCCSVLLPPPCLLVATFMHGVVTLGIRGTEVLTGRISAQHFLGCTGDWGLAAALFAAHATPVLERAALTLAGVLFLLIGLINMSVRALRRVQL